MQFLCAMLFIFLCSSLFFLSLHLCSKIRPIGTLLIWLIILVFLSQSCCGSCFGIQYLLVISLFFFLLLFFFGIFFSFLFLLLLLILGLLPIVRIWSWLLFLLIGLLVVISIGIFGCIDSQVSQKCIELSIFLCLLLLLRFSLLLRFGVCWNITYE